MIFNVIVVIVVIVYVIDDNVMSYFEISNFCINFAISFGYFYLHEL